MEKNNALDAFSALFLLFLLQFKTEAFPCALTPPHPAPFSLLWFGEDLEVPDCLRASPGGGQGFSKPPRCPRSGFWEGMRSGNLLNQKEKKLRFIHDNGIWGFWEKCEEWGTQEQLGGPGPGGNIQTD